MGEQTIDQALGTHVLLNSSNIPADTIIQTDIANGSITSEKISVFKSDEITSDGSAQSTAHGLGRTPSLVIVIPSDVSGVAAVYTEGTHTSTNCIVTVTTGNKYKIIAL